MAVLHDTLGHLDQMLLSTLYAASRRIAHARAAPQIYRALIECLRDVLGCTLVAIYTCELPDDKRMLTLVDSLGVGSLPGRIRPAAPWFAELGQHRVVEASPIFEVDPALLAGQMAAGAGHAPSAAAAVLGEGGLHAVVMVLWSTLDERPAAWDTVLSVLAEDAGYALDKIASLQPEALADTRDAQGLLTAVNAVTDIGLLYSNLLDRLLGAILGQILEVLQLGGGPSSSITSRPSGLIWR